MRIVGSPEYFKTRKVPTCAQDLMRHNCITLRLSSSGGIYAWELRDAGRDMEARVGGQVTFNGTYQMLHAALDGHGLSFLPRNLTQPYLDSGRLVSVMEEWCPSFPGLHAYYPSRRNSSLAMRLVIDAIRYKP